MTDLLLHQGHVLDVLPTMPAESVQTCITSPPYWALRDYGLPPSIWDGDPACEHAWGDELRGAWANNVSGPNGDKLNGKTKLRAKGAGNFCQHCGAWRGCLGLEPTPELYISHIVQVFRAVRRVLRKDGTCWLNIGDSYVAGGTGHQSIHKARGAATKMFSKGGRYRLDNFRKDLAQARGFGGLKPKDLCMIPARVALALQADGWWLRAEIVWHKPNAMCESVLDRPHRSHEYIYLLARSERYYYDAEAVREPLAAKTYTTFGSIRSSNGEADPLVKSQNWRGSERKPRTNGDGFPVGSHKRSVWTVGTTRFKGAHFATYPTALVEPCVLAGTSQYGCCSLCGAPWKRVLEKTVVGDWNPHSTRSKDGPRDTYGRSESRGQPADYVPPQTVGWLPTCKHADAERLPCSVLDPFSGAGTTLMTALRLGRRGVGIELNPDYLALSEQRIRADAPLFASASPVDNPPTLAQDDQPNFLGLQETEEVGLVANGDAA